MKTKAKFIKDLNKQKVIFIIRNHSYKSSIDTAFTLWDNGAKFVEITLNSKHAIKTLKYLSNNLPKDCYLGAGTIKNENEVDLVNFKNLSFIVTPVASKKLVNKINKKNLVSIIGSYTPTEIYNSYSWGADFIKVFPAKSPNYIKYLKGPLNEIPLIAVGGVNINNMQEYFKNGASGIALGGSFFEFDEKGNFNKSSLKKKIVKVLQKLQS